MPRLTAADRERLRGMARQGYSNREAADAIGCSRETARQVMAAAPAAGGVPAPATGGDLVSDLRALADDLAFDPARQAVVQRAVDALAAPPDEDDGPPIDPNAPPIEAARALAVALRRTHQRAEQVGDARGAAHAARTLSTLLPVVARLEAQAAASSENLGLTRRDVIAARDRVRTMFAAIGARPMTCARCGAALRAEIAGVALPVEPVEPQAMIGGAALVPSPGA